MDKNSRSTIIINSQNLEIVKMFINSRMNKLCIHNGNGVENHRAMKNKLSTAIHKVNRMNFTMLSERNKRPIPYFIY